MNQRLEFKADIAVDDEGLITGLAWPFGSADRVGDEIAPGAFKSAAAPLPLLFAHDPKQALGAWTGLVETAQGLEVRGQLLVNDVPRAKEVRALVKAGGIDGLSIGFITKKAVARKGGGRLISSLDLVEISLVSVPMHPGARVTSAKTADALRLAEAIRNAAAAWRA
ncbi:MAG: peptidase U35 [Bosea sp. 12-68-7]|nr:MAG: peptidase U35 [Bosea sp. 12-68-7]OYX01249.1 MAG: peptidase U35 [Bosea sp. 32-68-6]